MKLYYSKTPEPMSQLGVTVNVTVNQSRILPIALDAARNPKVAK
jgi:hypothetical protein